MTVKYLNALRSAKLTTLNTQIGTSALLKIYAGTRPANPDTAITSQTLLATLTCNATAFGTVGAGGAGVACTLTAGAISNGTAVATGTASFFRLTTSGGTAQADGDVATSGSDCNINNTSIATGQVVSCSSLVITEGNV